MRVVEPHQFNKIKKKSKKSKATHKALIIPLALGLVIVSYIFFAQKSSEPQTVGTTEETLLNSSEQAKESNSEQKLVTFTDAEFKDLYTSFAYPNTQPLIEAPPITGDAAADARIQQLAVARGYKLSAVPVANIVKVNEPYLTEDDLLQQNAKIGWDGLKAAATKESIPLQMTSAYRSIEFQRSVFLSRMRDAGITVGGIIDGSSDGAVQLIMNEVAPPGYSRHHNGYTIDLACDGIGLYGFKNTSCYEWISKDNFKIAKQNGWIPSYPEEADQQGPNPEPWEFIWVGTINLYE